MKLVVRFSVSIIALLFLYSCAKTGRPSGGPKDETAPLMVTANPPNETTNFTKDRIRIYFDEYIKLKDLNKQLIISPPLKNNPIITPQGNPSKYINIKILDTLKPNTTYTFNFGNSVQDNNEGNTLESFKYVMSTGNYIDSLTLKGSLRNALKKDTIKNSLVMLYEINDTYNDSIVYKKKPDYVTNTLNTPNFKLTNLREGKYRLVVLQQKNINYLFSPKTDKIGFLDTIIQLPQDSVLNTPIPVFKEVLPLKLSRPKEVSKGKILFGFEGDATDLQIELLQPKPTDFKYIAKFEPKKDTLNYWFTGLPNDSVFFKVTAKNNFIDTLKLKLRKKKTDSLTVSSRMSTLHLKDTFAISTNNPIVTIDTTKIRLMDKDSTVIPVAPILSKTKNAVSFTFKKQYNKDYQLKLYPKALVDIYQDVNDTLTFNFKTKTPEDYGSIILNISNTTTTSFFLELLNEKQEVLRRVFPTKSSVTFDLLRAGTYHIRAILDTNMNKKWDSGNYLKGIQPEKVIYFPQPILLNTNWEVNHTFTIK